MADALARARAGDNDAFRELTDPYRRELHVHCYRILGSFQDAEDLLQETLLSAWQALDRFDGRSLRAWLYRIATNRCLNYLRDTSRRPKVATMPESGSPFAEAIPSDEPSWLEPYPDALMVDVALGPEARYDARESIALSFVAGLQRMPTQQRAALVLSDVLGFSAFEVAEMLESTPASVNSALQRARATLAARDLEATDVRIGDAEQQALLARYVDAFERYDIESLVALLREDAVMSMPPYDFWLEGPVEMGRFFLGAGIGCEGSRLIATAANGSYAFGSYKPDPAGGHAPWAVQVIEVSGDRIVGHHNFLDTELFAVFGLPAHLP
jgi:RNA polymerase sigma-70 factor (ECF subfamily)